MSFTTRARRAVDRAGGDPVMVGRLVLHHGGEYLRQRALRAAYGRLVTGGPGGGLRLPACPLPRADGWPDELADALAALRAEADAAARHEVDLLGSGPVALGEDIDWHRDFKNGYRWPEVFYQDVVVTRLDDDSDAKAPWELSRGHGLLALGRAAAVFGEERYAAELEAQLTSWLDANPPGVGINWANPMEIAIRAINWVWALAALEGLRPPAAPLRERIARSLAAHGRHIHHNLEGSPQLRSNHYMADIAGLLVIAYALPDDPGARRWLRVARRALEREAREQILPDGVAFESSLPYHGLVLELMLLARVCAAGRSDPLSGEFDAVLRRMLRASLLLRHPGGRIPQFGDSDSGRILPAGSERPPSHDHLLWLGAAALGTPAPGDAAIHVEVALTLGLPAWQALAAAPPVPSELPAAESFADAGLHVLRSARWHAVLRCGEVGQNGNGGHSHNDLLSYELSLDGGAVVVDPGTYVYTSDPDARNAMRATAAHSTVEIEGEEINLFDPRELFRLPGQAHPLPFRVHAEATKLQLVCAHDGYRRLQPALTVTRTLTIDRGSHTVTVSDELSAPAGAAVRSRVQLAQGWSADTDPRALRLHYGGVALELTPLHGGVAMTEDGWVSDRFGVRERAVRVRIDAPSGATRFGYTISPAAA